MRREDRLPKARAPRRPHGQLLLLGGSIAIAVLLIGPTVAQWGRTSDGTGAVAGRAAGDVGPAASAPSAAFVLPRTSPQATPTSAPAPSPTGTPPSGPVSTASATPSPAEPATTAPSTAPSATPSSAPSATPPTTIAATQGARAAWPETVAPDPASLAGYRWPLAHPRLTLPFGPTPWGSRLVGGKTFHDGVDLATFCGDRVLAAHRGTVLAAGRRYDAYMGWIGDLRPYLRRLDAKSLWGQLPIIVVIDDGNGYRSMYAHFGRLVVKRGQEVRTGQLLGYEGATGRASGCHVHYGLFSPLERATFAIKPDVAKRMKLPHAEIARIDPLLVLPPKRGINAPKAPKASPSPKPGATTAP